MVKPSVMLLLGASSAVQACTAPVANEATVEFVAGFEGFRDYVYRDPGNGFQTLGYGHLCKKPNCAEVPYKFPPLSKSDGLKLLSSDMAIAEACVTKDISEKVVLNANQYGALVSWAFNVGCGNVASSSLIRRLNAGENPNVVAASELPKWDRDAKGDVLPGLARRRAAEVKLFETPTSEPGLPGCQKPPPPKTSKPAPPPTHTHTKSKPTETHTKSKPVHTHTKSKPTQTPTESTPASTPTVSTPASTQLPNTTLSTILSSSSSVPSNWTGPVTASSVSMTLSTVWTTTTHTVISCAPTVISCPAHSTVLVTETVPAYTTICPVTETEKSQGSEPTATVAPVSSAAAPTGSAPTSVIAPPVQGGNGTQPTAPAVAGAAGLSVGGTAVAAVAAALAAAFL